MHTKIRKLIYLALGLLLLTPGLAQAAEPTTRELLMEMQALKNRVNELEARLRQAQGAADQAHQNSTRSLKISEELSKTKDEAVSGLMSQAGKRLNIHGAVELEAGFSRLGRKQGSDENSSDFSLATAELFIEASLNDYTKGVIHFLWEDGDEAVSIDEAFILLGQTEDMPWYALGGRIYPAIGLFESSFISDPLTLELLETQETALEIGFANNWLNLGLGAFNSEVHEASDDPDSMINSFYGRVQVSAPEDLIPGLELSLGAALFNNIAASDFLREQVANQVLGELVAGWSIMGTATYGMVGVTAEYVAALDDFQDGELEYAGESSAKPWAFNLEVAVTPWEEWTFAAKYEAAGGVFDQMPETRWGAVASWEFMASTSLSLEYLRGEYENGDTIDAVTAQLAVEF